MMTQNNNAERLERYRSAAKELYHDRKVWGVCVVCGKPKKNEETTSLCRNCLQKRKDRFESMHEYVREQAKARRERHKAAGLCTYCNTPVVEGSNMCERHREYYRAQSKKQWARKKAANEASKQCL
jgi:hypothetical protein